MAETTTNLFKLPFDAISAMKKKDLVSEIEKLKGKVVFGNNIQNLCDQVSRLSENLAILMESNEKRSSQFIVVKKVNTLLEKRVRELKKSQAKAKQYSRRNNVEISGIPCVIIDNNRNNRNKTGVTKRVIVKIIIRKHSEDILQLKKMISSRSKVFISNSLCPYYRYLQASVKKRYLQSRFFCLGAVVTIKANENGLPVRINLTLLCATLFFSP